MKFPDVNEKSYYLPFIDRASEAGVMIGDDKGNFRPGDPLTRQEAAVIVCRMIDLMKNQQR